MVYEQRARGIRKSSLVITVAAAATAEDIYIVSANATVSRTVIVRKVWIYTAVGNVTVIIGTATTPLGIIPELYAINLFDNTWFEGEIPEVEVNENITVESDILGCRVQIECEEIGS